MMKDVHCKKEAEVDRHANGFQLQKLPVKDLNRFEMTEEVPVLSELSTSQCLIGFIWLSYLVLTPALAT
ncbi:hypothetical protein SRHO_G00290020 [Serrasalmus rhombeus]